MDELNYDALKSIDQSLGVLVRTAGEINTKLDQIAEVLGDATAKVPSGRMVEGHLLTMQETLNDLPGELASAMRQTDPRRGG